jgi:hypothetical protein
MENKSEPLMIEESTGGIEPEGNSTGSSKLWLIIVAAVILLGLIATAIFFLAKADLNTTSRVRDIFIIFMAFESIVIGVALVILVIQVATLINLLQNEVKPILKTTKETVDTLKGTTEFLSSNMVEPVIKLNGYLAVLKQLFDLFMLRRR